MSKNNESDLEISTLKRRELMESKIKERLPKLEFVNALTVALGAEIYPAIRAVAYRFSPEDLEAHIRYYLDREPVEDDYESIEVVANELEVMMRGVGYGLKTLDVDCVFSSASRGELDQLNGFIYARRENDKFQSD